MTRILRLTQVLVAAGLTSSFATTQCDPSWLPGDPVADVTGTVWSVMAWDPDGTGPLPVSPTICGRFAVGDLAAASVAWFDGTQWQPVGVPPGSRATAMVVHAGLLTVAFEGGVFQWTGASWQSIGTHGSGDFVYAMTTFQGDLVVGGDFPAIGGVPAENIAKWNGTSWAPLGLGANDDVLTLAVFNGVLHVGGEFGQVNGVSQVNYAIWNGTTWAPAPAFNGAVRALAVRNGTSLTNSFLFAGGDFNRIGTPPNHTPVSRIARFSPTTNTWTDFGGVGYCNTLTVRSTGLTGYELLAGVTSPPRVQRWSGGTWSPLGPPLADDQPVRRLAYLNGRYTVATEGGPGEGAVQQLVGSEWQSLSGPGVRHIGTAVCDGGTDVVLAHEAGVHRGGPNAWVEMPGLEGHVRVLARMPNGTIVAGGTLSMASGMPVTGLAQWNGSTWAPVGGGVAGDVEALLPMPNGDLIVGGTFPSAGSVLAANIARWNGVSWSPLGGGADDTVLALLALPNGDVLAGGRFLNTDSFSNSTPRIARWNGSIWSPVSSGSGFNAPIHALALDASGAVVAGGDFTAISGSPVLGLARWPGGIAWFPVTSTGLVSLVRSIATLPSGDLLVRVGNVPTGDGASLRRIGSTNTILVDHRTVRSLGVAANGEPLIAGSFTVLDGAVTQGFARLTTPCPAIVAPGGAGCGGNALTADNLPWAGTTFQATATGLPQPALALTVTGLAPVVPPLPLVAVLPNASPACLLHTTSDLVDAAFAPSGSASTQLALPMTPTVAGIGLTQQVVTLQLGVGGAITGTTATNAITLTVGFF